jgi:hypothetical protein
MTARVFGGVKIAVVFRARWLVGGVMFRESGGRAAALYIGLGVARTFWNDFGFWGELGA